MITYLTLRSMPDCVPVNFLLKWLYIILAAAALLTAVLHAGHWVLAKTMNYQRTNTECVTDERVFDNAGVLSDKEEEKLRRLIAKREKQTGCDIVLVTLNEPLEEYARAIEPGVASEEYVRVYAEKRWENDGFGYDVPDGDGVMLVDNWSREDDGRIPTRWKSWLTSWDLTLRPRPISWQPWSATTNCTTTRATTTSEKWPPV